MTTTPEPDQVAEVLARVAGEHQHQWGIFKDWPQSGCTCGARDRAVGDVNSSEISAAEHRAHLAVEQAAALRAAGLMVDGTEVAALQEQLAAVASLRCVVHLADDTEARCDTVGAPLCGTCWARAAIADPDSALTKVRAAAVDAVRLELVRLNDIGNDRIHKISTDDMAWFRTHPLLAEAETAVLSKAVPAFITWLEELANGLRQGAGQ